MSKKAVWGGSKQGDILHMPDSVLTKMTIIWVEYMKRRISP